MNKNDEFEVTIEGYASEGQGVARVDGFVVFVPYSIAGERVLVHIIKVSKSYAVGKIKEILVSSPERISPPCPYFGKCGGCHFQHIPYERTLEIKRQFVVDALERIGGFKGINVKNTVKSENFYNYRNKSAFPIVAGEKSVCMFKNLSHLPVYIDSCLIASEKTNEVIEVFEKYFVSLKEEEKRLYKFIVLRVIEGQILVTLVADKLIKAKEFYSLLDEKFAGNKVGLFWCKKDMDNNVILEGEIKHLFGIEKIETELMGVKVEVSPLSFFQVNLSIMKKIYAEVQGHLGAGETVIDAYSGAGLMSALLALKAKKVYGIEINKDATRDAEKIKSQNNLKNLVNLNGDANKVLPRLASEIKDFSLVIDPPRKGIEKNVVETIIKSAPKKIVYVSCSPSSLARDVKLILEGGYEIESVTPYDMFPETNHVETVLVLKKI